MPSYEVAIGTQNELLFNYLRQNLLRRHFQRSNAACRCAAGGRIYTVGRAEACVSAPETLSLGCLSIVFAVNLNCRFVFTNRVPVSKCSVVPYYVNYFSLFLLPLLAMFLF
ncbi:MAG: hypothetical protein ACLR1R_06410 [Ruminococcus callidus]